MAPVPIAKSIRTEATVEPTTGRAAIGMTSPYSSGGRCRTDADIAARVTRIGRPAGTNGRSTKCSC